MNNAVKLRLPETAPYTFSVQSPLQQRWIPLSFTAVDDSTKPWLQVVWLNMINALKAGYLHSNQPAPKWSNWRPWQWCYETAQLDAGRTPVLAWAEGYPVGFLTLWGTNDAKPCVYIEHIGATPGDIATPLWERRYHNVGWSLMAYAIHISKENGFEGRIGLHAETEEVLEKVYNKYAEAVPGLFQGGRTGIPGPTPFGLRKNMTLTYLETTEAGAGQFLEGFRDA